MQTARLHVQVHLTGAAALAHELIGVEGVLTLDRNSAAQFDSLQVGDCEVVGDGLLAQEGAEAEPARAILDPKGVSAYTGIQPVEDVLLCLDPKGGQSSMLPKAHQVALHAGG